MKRYEIYQINCKINLNKWKDISYECYVNEKNAINKAMEYLKNNIYNLTYANIESFEYDDTIYILNTIFNKIQDRNYRRSLAVGDVIKLDNTYYLIMPYNFAEIKEEFKMERYTKISEMEHDKSEPIYYKEKLKELLKQAKENDVNVYCEKGVLNFVIYKEVQVGKLRVKTPLRGVSINLKEI